MSRIQPRRKSSYFRPSSYYDSFIETTNIESLPILTLSQIFSYLNTPDLLRVCVVGRLFYMPAIMQLYDKIIVVDDRSFFQSMTCETNFGALMEFKKLGILIRTLETSGKLSSYVRQLVFINNKIDFSNDTNMMNLVKLLDLVRLRQFIHPGINTNVTSLLKLETVTSICVCLKHDNQTNFTFHLPSLKHFKVFYENKETNKNKFTILASELVKHRTIDQLESLEFEELIVKDLKLMNQDFDNWKLAIWIEFFGALREEQQVHKLSKFNSLNMLSLDGFINDQGPKLSSLLNEIFDLNNLKTLIYNIKEFSHLNEVHYMNSHNLLINIVNHSNLSSLVITPTFNCLTCQLNMVLGALGVLNGKLKSLKIKYEFLTFDNCKDLIKVISSTQPNLTNLELYDKSREFANGTEFKKHVKNYEEFERVSFNLQLLEKSYPIRINSGDIERRLLTGFYRANSDDISKYLKGYLKSINLDLNRFKLLQEVKINNIGIVNYLGRFSLNSSEAKVNIVEIS